MHTPNGSSALMLVPLAVLWTFGSSIDLFLFSFFALVRNWDVVVEYVCLYIGLDTAIGFAKVLLSLLILLQIIRSWRGLHAQKPHFKEGDLRPLFFPCTTSHTRLFPEKHTFAYSYLLVGVPVAWRGSVGGMISADVAKKPWYSRWVSLKPDPGNTWYTVGPEDYLERGHVHLGLQGKLHRYLKNEGICPETYPYAYLLTAPKFLGYVSNPVSFWCLYSAEKVLKAMILEVNNTFNERRMYFVEADQGRNLIPAASEDIEVDWQNFHKAGDDFASLGKSSKASTRFTKSWPKDFYVSVFNSRKGAYSLVAYDPLYPSLRGTGPVNSTITLSSSKEHAKLVARIFSTDPAIDPATMSLWEKTKFLATWWWVGLATFPRTLVQAWVILFHRKLHLWFRPEPLKETIARPANEIEAALETTFRKYLRNLVTTAGTRVMVKYIPSGIAEALEEIMISPSAQIAPEGLEELEFKVLTPLFYARFVNYADDFDAFISEIKEGRTIWISNPLLLPDLLSTQPLFRGEMDGRWETFCFKTIQTIRTRPAPIGGTSTAKDLNMGSPVLPERDLEQTYNQGLSGMDRYILMEGEPAERSLYRTQILKLILSDHFALGSLDILALEVFIIRILVAWVVASNCNLQVSR